MDIAELKKKKASELGLLNEIKDKAKKENRSLSVEETAKTADMIKNVKQINEQIKRVEDDEKLFAEIEAENRSLTQIEERKSTVEFGNVGANLAAKSDERALDAFAGHWFLALQGSETSKREILNTRGIHVSSLTEGENSKGGLFVPDEILSRIIFNRDKYGKARGWVTVSPMSRDVQQIPVDNSDVSFAFYGEATAFGEEDKEWSLVELVAKKCGKIVLFSAELEADAVVQIGQLVIETLARAAAKIEDGCLINGDGTPTYGGTVGLKKTFEDGIGSLAGSVQATSGNDTMAEYTEADILKAQAALPEYAYEGDVAWYCSLAFKINVFDRLAAAKSGNAKTDMANGTEYKWNGYPVRTSPLFYGGSASTDQSNKAVLFFGDMKRAVLMGDRNQFTVSRSDEYKWNSQQVAIMGSERIAINVHAVGDANDAGPLVALIGN